MGEVLVVIEVFGEGFEVDVGCIEVVEECGLGLRGDVVGCYCDCFEFVFVVGGGCVDCVFGEDYGVVVGEGYVMVVGIDCGLGDGFWCGEIGEVVVLFCFGDVLVLVEVVVEVVVCGVE